MTFRASKTVQWLRALAALPEKSIVQFQHSHGSSQESLTRGVGNPTPSPDRSRNKVHMWCICTYRIHTLKIN